MRPTYQRLLKVELGMTNYSKSMFASSKVIDFDAIKSSSLNSSLIILRRLLPDGKIVGCEYVARNPTRDDRSLGSFKINIRTGRWADFATQDCGGDIISLVAYLRGLKQGEAAKLLADMLGISSEVRR